MAGRLGRLRLIVVMSLAMALFLTACTSRVPQEIRAGNELFDRGDYEGALEEYRAVDFESEDYTEAARAIYEHGIVLFELGRYAEAATYFSNVPQDKYVKAEFEDVDSYFTVCHALQQASSGQNEMNYARRLVELRDEGFKPAEEALENEAFADYVPLAERAGLYRSIETIEHYETIEGSSHRYGGAMEVYSYLLIDYNLHATTLASEGALYDMDAEKAQERSSDSRFECTVKFVSEGRYHCIASYSDVVEGKGYNLEFDLVLSGESLTVESLVSSEPDGDHLLYEGEYVRC